MANRIPTFRTRDALLTGSNAIAAWSQQRIRCNCGSYGDEANSISGSCNDMPAKWLGCDNCTGQAVGRPLVYRLANQLKAANQTLAAKGGA